MDRQRLSFIKMDALKGVDEDILSELEIANGVLSGQYANYDGTDGARSIRRLCGYIQELVDEIEKLQSTQYLVVISGNNSEKK